MRRPLLQAALALTLTALLASPGRAAEKPVKAFLLAGQSNMVGWGDSRKLPDELRKGSDRVLMFEQGKWQPLRPHEPANQGQRRVGLTEFHFGPEIAFAQAMAGAWPDETVGIVKLAVGGTSLLAWKPDWSKEDADRVGQGRHGSLYKKLMEKVKQAQSGRHVEIAGFLWLQGGGDMKKVDVAKEYLDNLESLVAAVRRETGVADLPFLYGSPRAGTVPDDLSGLVPKPRAGRYPAAEFVLKAQFDAEKEISHAKMVILRDIEKHPKNVHYNTAGQLETGKRFAWAFLRWAGEADNRLGGKTALEILTMLGAKGEAAVRPEKLEEYRRIFGFLDADKDGDLSVKEFVEDGRYMTRQARQGIFQASDGNGDKVVSEEEYVTNRIITDEAKAILSRMDEDGDGKVGGEEFLAESGLREDLAKAVFSQFDSDGNGQLVVPEYLRVWGRWARGR
jgi:Ca2+-binding EF-hand superfamily protein